MTLLVSPTVDRFPLLAVASTSTSAPRAREGNTTIVSSASCGKLRAMDAVITPKDDTSWPAIRACAIKQNSSTVALALRISRASAAWAAASCNNTLCQHMLPSALTQFIRRS